MLDSLMQKSRPTHGEPIKFYRDFTLLVSNWFHIGLQLTDTRVKAWRGGGRNVWGYWGKEIEKMPDVKMHSLRNAKNSEKGPNA